MSETAAAVILGGVIVLLIKTRWLRLSGALLCAAFGIVVAAGPVGPAASDVLKAVGSWAYDSLRSL
jgi:hypothetical protein